MQFLFHLAKVPANIFPASTTWAAEKLMIKASNEGSLLRMEIPAFRKAYPELVEGLPRNLLVFLAATIYRVI